MTRSEIPIRRAGVRDAKEVARLLHDFNTEFSEPTPGPKALARRARQLLESGEITVLLGGGGPDGIALIRFRPSIWSDSLDAYLEEFYVAPERRGRGIGRVLLDQAITVAREAGAMRMELGTGETDTVARALYERFGFTNREGPDGPLMMFYERDI